MSTVRSTASARPAPAADGDEAGFGLVGTLVGFVIFLVLLLFATQVIVRLYATSVVTSAATRAAEAVAQAPDPVAETAPAETAARRQLGSFEAARSRFVWEEIDASRVVLRVVAQSPEFLPGLAGWTRISRQVTVRTERFR